MQFTPESLSVVELSRIEEHYTRAGRAERVCGSAAEELRGQNVVLPSGSDVWFDDYLSRLYIEPVLQGTTAAFVELGLIGQGDALVEVYFVSEDEQILLTQDILSSRTVEPFRTSPICIGDLPAGGSLLVRVQALKGEANLSHLIWQARASNGAIAQGLKLVLIRTFGNRDIVLNNLSTIQSYLNETGRHLDDYLFVVYDATGRDELPVADSFPSLHVFELSSGNFGGGGNASLLTHIALQATETLPEGAVSDVILWDDDASIEPEFLFRHRGFVALGRQDVAHTAMIMSKKNPEMVQEYGGIWGGFFSRVTHQIDASVSSQRRMFPYLVRHGRTIDRDIERLSTSQNIEFGTFIFLSIPMTLLRRCGGPVPFFLRNDDVDLCLRIQRAGGRLICNQNILSWHDASYNFLGEFFASLHGWIVNNTHFEFPRGEFLSTTLEKLQACHSVGNAPLLEAYRLALNLYRQGPAWFNSPQVFEVYQETMGALKSAAACVAQVPQEVHDTLDRAGGLELHDLYDGTSRRRDAQRQVVFIDKARSTYHSIDADPLQLDEALHDAVVLTTEIASNYGQLADAWRQSIDGFSLEDFWGSFAQAHVNFVRQSIAENGRSFEYVSGSSPWQVSKELRDATLSSDREAAKSNLAIINSDESTLPPDFHGERYLRLNPDVKNAGVDAAEHYLLSGRHENRKYR